MGLNLGPILYMALACYLIIALVLGAALFAVVTFFVRRYARRARIREELRQEEPMVPRFAGRMNFYHQPGHA